VTGELIVDKLLERPVTLSLSANYDPSKIAMQGSVRMFISFKFISTRSVVAPSAKTLDELKALRTGEIANQAVLARDAPARTMISAINLALGQYAQKMKRYPASLAALVDSNYIGKDTLTPDILSKIIYVAYVNKPLNGMTPARCTDKGPVCNFFHIGTSLEFKNSPELTGDADFNSPAINGSDSAGCRNEVDRACYDLIGDLAASAPVEQGSSTPPTTP
jgi:hypothetical protein